MKFTPLCSHLLKLSKSVEYFKSVLLDVETNILAS
jgi:hypothetical protein